MFAKITVFLILTLTSYFSFSQDIFEAARNGDLKKIKEITEVNAEAVKAVNDQGFTPLMIACYRGQTKAAKLLVEKGAEVNSASPEGSALQAAVYQNNTKLACFLLEKGANMNAKGPDGNTALMYAVLNQNEKLVKALVNKGADLKLVNNDNQTAHSLAMTQENKTIQVLTQF